MVQIAVDIWVLLLTIGAPFKLYVPVSQELGLLCALQPWITVGTFPILFAYWGVLAVCDLIQKPFNADIDTINIDALVAGTEETLFANLRAKFNLQEARKSAKDLDTSEMAI
eukprot:TRINITY_DN25518_c0_g1_i2.p2 TRINITY_DN25518_c0_g1~~TRINITY_DN25518_c0_g1_i2.p2  ORF type:complete len:112 (+),score=15.23 TRINITY_DN25518_c0_g1_i2:3-338(+)